VVDLKVRLIFRLLVRFWLAKRCRLAHVVLVQLGKEGLVGSLREHALLLQDGQDAHRLTTHDNTFETHSRPMYKNVSSFTARFYVFTFLFFSTFCVLKMMGKWLTHVVKQQIKMTFSFVRQ